MRGEKRSWMVEKREERPFGQSQQSWFSLSLPLLPAPPTAEDIPTLAAVPRAGDPPITAGRPIPVAAPIAQAPATIAAAQPILLGLLLQTAMAHQQQNVPIQGVTIMSHLQEIPTAVRFIQNVVSIAASISMRTLRTV